MQSCMRKAEVRPSCNGTCNARVLHSQLDLSDLEDTSTSVSKYEIVISDFSKALKECDSVSEQSVLLCGRSLAFARCTQAVWLVFTEISITLPNFACRIQA